MTRVFAEACKRALPSGIMFGLCSVAIYRLMTSLVPTWDRSVQEVMAIASTVVFVHTTKPVEFCSPLRILTFSLCAAAVQMVAMYLWSVS